MKNANGPYALLFLTLSLQISGLCIVTSGIPESDLHKRVPMTKLWFTGDHFDTPVRTADFTLTREVDGSTVASASNWRAVLPVNIEGLWKTELRSNTTYYFAGSTGAVGMEAPAWILVLSFDEHRRPIPFYVSTYATYDMNGIADVVDLDGKGPQLIHQDWSTAGYYITTIYEQRGLYWFRLDGVHGTRQFPLFEEWDKSSSTHPRIIAPPRGSAQWVGDYGSDPRRGVRARIFWSGKDVVRVEPSLGCDLESIAIETLDSAGRREILVAGAGTVENLASRSASVVLFGIKHWQGTRFCTASMVWER